MTGATWPAVTMSPTGSSCAPCQQTKSIITFTEPAAHAGAQAWRRQLGPQRPRRNAKLRDRQTPQAGASFRPYSGDSGGWGSGGAWIGLSLTGRNHDGLPILPNANPEITLAARNLSRRFGNRQVIHDLSLELRRGEVLGLLGHNGAGKTTTLQMLTGCLLPGSGEIEICGIDLLRQPELAKAQIGYLPETPPLYRERSVDDYLTFAARLRGMKPGEAAEALVRAK